MNRLPGNFFSIPRNSRIVKSEFIRSIGNPNCWAKSSGAPSPTLARYSYTKRSSSVSANSCWVSSLRDMARRSRPAHPAISQLIEHIPCAEHRPGALADQLVTARTLGNVDVARHRQHLPALVLGRTNGMHGAALHRGLHHDYPIHQSTDDAVPRGKISPLRSGPRRVFAHDPTTVFQHPADLRSVGSRIHDIHPAAQHRYRRAAGVQVTPMGADIQAVSEPWLTTVTPAMANSPAR